jgi:hypothetical protein
MKISILKVTETVATSGLDWNPDQIVVTDEPVSIQGLDFYG